MARWMTCRIGAATAAAPRPITGGRPLPPYFHVRSAHKPCGGTEWLARPERDQGNLEAALFWLIWLIARGARARRPAGESQGVAARRRPLAAALPPDAIPRRVGSPPAPPDPVPHEAPPHTPDA
jgi:hypothetical protein